MPGVYLFSGKLVVVERKLAALKVHKSRSVRPVLVYDGNLSRRVPADGFFVCIVSGEELLGRPQP